MKRIFVLFFVILLLTGCGAKPAVPETTAVSTTVSTTVETTVPETTETVPEETEPPVIYADQLVDGVYEITVDSSSSMFRVVHCELTVSEGSMTAAMTMSGDGYGMVYMGTGEAALAADETSYIPFVLTEAGAKVFTVPVEALNMDLDCAAWSIRKEKWYDRTLVFESAQLPVEAFVQE